MSSKFMGIDPLEGAANEDPTGVNWDRRTVENAACVRMYKTEHDGERYVCIAEFTELPESDVLADIPADASNTHILIPIGELDEFIHQLRRAAAGPLGRQALDAECAKGPTE